MTWDVSGTGIDSSERAAHPSMLTESRPGIALLQPGNVEHWFLAISDSAAVASVRVTFSLSTCELGERPHASERPAVLAFVVCFRHCMRGVPCSAACRCHSVDAICGHGRWRRGAERPGDNVPCSRGLQAWCLATCSLVACKASRCRATCGYDLVNVISVQGSCS